MLYLCIYLFLLTDELHQLFAVALKYGLHQRLVIDARSGQREHLVGCPVLKRQPQELQQWYDVNIRVFEHEHLCA